MLQGICFPGGWCAGGRGGGKRLLGIHYLLVCTMCTLCLAYAHRLSLKYEGYRTLKI